MDTVSHQLHANSPDILVRQRHAIALRAKGLTVKEVARELKCSPYVAQTLLARAADARIDAPTTAWLSGLPHRTARALLAHGYKDKQEVANDLISGQLTSDLPGIGAKTLRALADWLAES